MSEASIDRLLDAKGLLCPMPIVKAKLSMDEMEPGQVLKVLATDPASPGDFAAWCNETGNPLLETGEEDNVYVFTIQKG